MANKRYKVKLAEINKKIEQINRGIAEEYENGMEQLRNNMIARIRVAKNLRKVHLDNIENYFEAEKLAARQNFENEKDLLYDELKEQIEEQINKLEEEKCITMNNFLTNEEDESVKTGKDTSKKSCKGSKKRHKPTVVTGPYIVYQLKESEILEDLALVKLAIASTERNSDC